MANINEIKAVSLIDLDEATSTQGLVTFGVDQNEKPFQVPYTLMKGDKGDKGEQGEQGIPGDTAQDEVIYNVSQKNNKYDYPDKQTARNAVPSDVRGRGQQISYQLSTGEWVTEQYIGSDVSGWGTDSNWEETISNKTLKGYQTYIEPKGKPEFEPIEIVNNSYLRNVAVRDDGTLDATNPIYRSLVNLPIFGYKIIQITNPSDTISGKRIVFFNQSGIVISTVIYTNSNDSIFNVPTDAYTVSITLISAYSESTDLSVIKLSISRESGDYEDYISEINGYPIKGGISKEEADEIYQSIILPDREYVFTEIQVSNSPYLKNCTVRDDGSLDTSNPQYRSLVELPWDESEAIRINNLADYESNKRVVFFDSSKNKISHLIYNTGGDFIPPKGTAFVSITLISAYANSTDLTLAHVSEGTATGSFKPYIEEINGYPLVAVSQTSGGFKYASVYGFLDSNTAEQNANVLQSMLDGGGTVVIDKPGTYPLCNSILLDSNTTLIFGADVSIRKEKNSEGKSAAYQFINRGAFSRTYNENIKIIGLNLICNGNEMGDDIERIPGLRGHIALFYVKDVEIRDAVCLDLLPISFFIHICTFENFLVDTIKVFGRKDGVHISKGKNFIVRNGIFKTYDDPISLNSHDYVSGGCPQLGWIENGLIENCFDLNATETVGYFIRITGGSWLDWYSGMQLQQGDTVVSNNRLYRVNMTPSTTIYTSTTAPTHTDGEAVLDGINWLMVQDDDIIYNCGVRNVILKNIHLQKARPVAISIKFDNDMYSRGYYPNSIAPFIENITLEDIYVENIISEFIQCNIPIKTVKLINAVLQNNKIVIDKINTEGLIYGNANLLLSNTTFKGTGQQTLISSNGRNTNIKTLGSVIEDSTYIPTKSGSVNVISSDIGI